MSRPARVGNADGLAAELQAVGALKYGELRHRFLTLYGTLPAPRLSRDLLLRAIAYRVQEMALGGLSASLRRLLAEAVGESANGSSTRRVPKRKATPGTVLIRQWRGVAHHVSVLEEGVLYRGERYRSLSQVARMITRSRWSGPAFFGLRTKHGPR
jgi:Protein of unknown function (DUF2924)